MARAILSPTTLVIAIGEVQFFPLKLLEQPVR